MRLRASTTLMTVLDSDRIESVARAEDPGGNLARIDPRNYTRAAADYGKINKELGDMTYSAITLAITVGTDGIVATVGRGPFGLYYTPLPYKDRLCPTPSVKSKDS
jgi:hypothetical protein